MGSGYAEQRFALHRTGPNSSHGTFETASRSTTAATISVAAAEG
jgi:hypothetical protein